MHSTKPIRMAGCLLLATGLLISAACDRQQESAPAATQDATRSEAVPDPYQPGAPLPPNHPPMDGIMAGMPGDIQSGGGGAADEIAGHPPGALQKAKDVEVVLPDSVKGKWSAVQLRISRMEEAAGEYTVPVGGETALGDSGMRIAVDAFLPDYSSDFKKATSRSDSLNNPAVLVRLLKGDEQIAKGWVFRNYPDFNTFRSDSLQLELGEIKSTSSQIKEDKQ